MPQLPEMFKSKVHERNYMTAYDQTLSLWEVNYESVYVETEYGLTHILISGPADGEPVILLNGFGFSATMWYPNIKALTATFRVYAIDVIGEFNRSVVKKHFRERSDYANWLTEVLDRTGIQEACFIGHSNGGWHVLNFAMHAQSRVKSMILLAPAASFTPFSKQFGIRLLAANIIRTRPVIIHFFAKWFVNKNNRHNVSDSLIEQFYHGIVGFAWKYKILIPTVYTDEELMGIRVPTLLMVGTKEVIYNHKRAVTRATRLIPHIQTRLIPGVGHGTNLENADFVNREIIRFLHQEGH